jgi:hypothetical protein
VTSFWKHTLAADRALRLDLDGRLHVESTPISNACINAYWGREIPGSIGRGTSRPVRCQRTEEELLRLGRDSPPPVAQEKLT